MKLRPYQQQARDAVHASWRSGKRAPCAVLPTGGGKTVLFSSLVRDSDCPSLVMAHRQELVSQMSLTLARYGVRHRVIAPAAVRRSIEALHVKVLGRRWVDPHAPAAAAGVDTLARMDAADPFLRSVGLWVGDEGHHFLADNKWGRAVAMLPESARGLGVTATPVRADGKGLGSHAHGVYDDLIVGPSMRDLIADGMLTDYRWHAPAAQNLDLSAIKLASNGDYSAKPLGEAVRRSSIVGDVVANYLRIAPGKLGITFATNLEHARDICTAYNAAGVAAAVLSGESDPGYRAQVMRQFEAGELLQLVNVDILGEGVDVPACEVVSFARPTMSFGLFVQQAGRALRLMIPPELMARWGDLSRAERLAHIAASKKPVAHIIDHVRNWETHRLPDSPRNWTLDARARGNRRAATDDAIPLRTCLNEAGGVICANVYERVLIACPVCGHVPQPAARSAPELVDGDLFELDPAVLAALRGEADRLAAPPAIPHNADHVIAMSIRKRHHERQQAQGRLGQAIATWGGWQNALGRDDREAYRRFYFAFGVDVATARTLGRPDAEALAQQVENVIQSAGIVTIGD